MDKKSMEIGYSTGLVLLLIILMIGIQLAVPQSLRPTGFVAAMALFMLLMAAAGMKLINTS